VAATCTIEKIINWYLKWLIYLAKLANVWI
jgi:hypothetical protein